MDDGQKPAYDPENGAYLKATDARVSRRGFAGLAAAAGVALADTANAQAAVVETEVNIATPDGVCDAALFHSPGKGPWPGVVMFPDGLGLRPVFRDMGRRLAAAGYTVLAPNHFYRAMKAPVNTGPFDFANPADAARMAAWRKGLTPEGIANDEQAYIAFLDTQPMVSRTRKMGVVGYCMGGPMVMQTSALRPDRVGASCSFHGGSVVTDKPDSPHLLAPKIQAKSYFGIAQNDAMRQPDQKEKLVAAFAAAGNPIGAEVYPADHGWCIVGGAAYNKDAAERAWDVLLTTFKAALV